jgi:hypothetical protein
MAVANADFQSVARILEQPDQYRATMMNYFRGLPVWQRQSLTVGGMTNLFERVGSLRLWAASRAVLSSPENQPSTSDEAMGSAARCRS